MQEIETVEGGRIVMLQRWKVLIPEGTRITSADRLKVNNRIYEVMTLDHGRTDAIFLVAICKTLD